VSFVISGTSSFSSIRLYIVSLSKKTLALIAKYSINNNSEYQPIQNQDTKENDKNDIQRHRDCYQQEQKDTGDHFKGCAQIPQMKMTDMQMMFHRLSKHKPHLLPLKLIQTKLSIFPKSSVQKKLRGGVLPEPSIYIYSLWRTFFNT
jgi:hypothetical protein